MHTPSTSFHSYRAGYPLLRGLLDLLLAVPERFRGQPMIEIGTNIGDSAEIFSLFFSPVFCVDPILDDGYMQTTSEEILSILRSKIGHRNIRHIRGYSADVSDRFDAGGYAMVYIDGDHRYEGVKNDILLYYPKVVAGGLICGHDYDNPDVYLGGVKQAVDELFGKPDLVFADTSWLVFKKE